MKIKKSKVVVLACIAAVLVVGIYVVISLKTKQTGFPGMMAGKKQTGVVSVKTSTAEVQTLRDYVNTNGEIETQSSIEVFPDIGGKVVNVYVSLGSPVKRGDKIADIDPSEPGVEYEKSPVYAPISGTITKSPLKNGTTVSVSSVITTIGDVANLQITSRVPERYVASLRQGLKADISLEAYPDKIFSASVTRVSPVVDSASRTKEIILNFTGDYSLVNAGMFAKVHLYTDVYSGKVVIPSSAVIEKDESNCIYVVNEDGKTVSRREVKLGKSVDSLVQILEGLNAGEKIVVEGMRSLSDGAEILDITDGIPLSNEKSSEALSPDGEAKQK